MSEGSAPFDGAPVVRPHPRIRQRRVEVRRDEGRRRLRFLLWSVGVAGAMVLGFGATRSPLLDVDTVEVRGATNTRQEDVLRASGLDRSPPLTDVDAHEVEAAIERLPWVESARVARRWPGTVEVTLLERTPLAAVPAPDGAWALADLSGRVLSHEPAPPGELIRIEHPQPVGAPGSTVPRATLAALRLVDALPPQLAGRVPVIAVGENGGLEVRLDGKTPVQLGPPSQLDAKLVALGTLLQKADLARVASIDVRVPTAPVLTRR
ncbi:MAG TPA: FtsQ-type POTRA domain-containing protein [Acidimicrobiales bacterium]